MPKSITHNFGLDYDTGEMKDAELTICNPVINLAPSFVFNIHTTHHNLTIGSCQFVHLRDFLLQWI